MVHTITPVVLMRIMTECCTNQRLTSSDRTEVAAMISSKKDQNIQGDRDDHKHQRNKSRGEIGQFKMQSHTLPGNKEFCNGQGHDMEGERGRCSD